MAAHKHVGKNALVAELLVGDHGAGWSLSPLSPTPTVTS